MIVKKLLKFAGENKLSFQSISNAKFVPPQSTLEFSICSLHRLRHASAEIHRTVLNQILRQSTVHLANGSFSALVAAVPTRRPWVMPQPG